MQPLGHGGPCGGQEKRLPRSSKSEYVICYFHSFDLRNNLRNKPRSRGFALLPDCRASRVLSGCGKVSPLRHRNARPLVLSGPKSVVGALHPVSNMSCKVLRQLAHRALSDIPESWNACLTPVCPGTETHPSRHIGDLTGSEIHETSLS